ncbi:molecular chaperone [Achromobacter anxifer]|jgi:fimbrial chaperone protein|uniref:fimbrial biogenesis chaperone n=1 Tax=Achromobacter anxifer TaxID=1287737 RepID=UPI00155B8FC7|nr:molecular chaperone [Achromobacter anxifer]MDF8365876.1 molecular chaperone [Achromobacter anxifer]CAB5510908.1 putative fimbrial chaperone LpfB [Achromobacter anxifer]
MLKDIAQRFVLKARPFMIFALAAALACAADAEAGVLVGGTRVIFNEKERESSIPVKNTGAAPYVVQAWIDAGEGNTKTPFVASPPLSRLDPGQENVLRILRLSGSLPQDRESVFWLNVKEIPEKSQDENVLQIAVRTRIKLFYRPSGLAGKPGEQRQQLQWAVAAGDKGAVLKIANPSAYHVTFATLNINQGQQQINGGMVPPGGALEYPLSGQSAPKDMDVVFTTINDYGAETPEEKVRVPSANTPVHVKAEPVVPAAGR